MTLLLLPIVPPRVIQKGHVIAFTARPYSPSPRVAYSGATGYPVLSASWGFTLSVFDLASSFPANLESVDRVTCELQLKRAEK